MNSAVLTKRNLPTPGAVLVYVMVLVLPWATYKYIPGIPYPSPFIVAGLLFSAILLQGTLKRDVEVSLPVLSFAALISVAGISIAWTIHPEVWRRDLAWWLVCFLCFWATLIFIRSEYAVRLFAFSCAIGAAITLPQLTRGFYEMAGDAFAVRDHNPNLTAYFLVCASTAMLIALQSVQMTKADRAILWCSVGLIFVETIMLSSRSSQGAIVLSVIAYHASKFAPHWLRSAVCLAMLAVALLAPSSFILQMLTAADIATHESNIEVSTRGVLWPEAVNLFFANPLLGIGPGSFPFLSESGLNVHNVFLDLLVSFGSVGWAAFVAICYSVWREVRHHKGGADTSKLFLVMLAGLLPILSTGHITNMPMPWIVMALMVCVARAAGKP